MTNSINLFSLRLLLWRCFTFLALSFLSQASAAVIFTKLDIPKKFQLDSSYDIYNPYQIDINDDGVVDIEIRNSPGGHFLRTPGPAKILAYQTDSSSSPNSSAYRLSEGTVISGATTSLVPDYGWPRGYYAATPSSPCGLVTRYDLGTTGEFQRGWGYAGFEIEIAGKTHYGWLEMGVDEKRYDNVETGYMRQILIYGWAFEDQAGVSIIAGVPEPSTLSLVALGLLMLCRRRR